MVAHRLLCGVCTSHAWLAHTPAIVLLFDVSPAGRNIEQPKYGKYHAQANSPLNIGDAIIVKYYYLPE
jgi:hypothetical protein